VSTHPIERSVSLSPVPEAPAAPQGSVGYLSQDLGDYLRGTQIRVDNVLETIMPRADSPFNKFYQHVLSGSAKRLRPALVYMTADTFGISRDRVDGYAAVDELFHSDSLVIDDMQDGDDERRGREAAHTRFDWDLAITGSHRISFHANELLAGIDAAAGLGGDLSTYVNQMLGKMCEGQVLDKQASEQKPSEVKPATLEEIAALKTGAAIQMSVVGAARIGEVPGDQIHHLGTYARHAGIAFQIKDDLLDPVVPKTNGSHYVAVAGVEATRKSLWSHREMAKVALRHLTRGTDTTKFEELVDYIVTRGH
jgi:geranylgeranyl diphosphate synthase, type II